MISFQEIQIKEIGDYDQLYDKILPYALDQFVVERLKQYLNLKCKKILIEYPYHDKDYLSTYYCYYSKKFRGFQKKCYRLHILGKEDRYFGFIVLRPTVTGTRIGTTCLAPQLLLRDRSYIILGTFEAHILGSTKKISCFPWMMQETDISVCAHVAAWTILRYYGMKYHNYADTVMGDIIQKIQDNLGRKTPSSGLTPIQVSDLFKEYGFSPIIRGRNQDCSNVFLDEVIAYVESGIPTVGFLSPKQHAVSIIGHGRVAYEILDSSEHIERIRKKDTGIILHSSLISSLIVMEDNYFAYREVTKNLPDQKSDVDYNLFELAYTVVPLYEKMQLVYNEVYARYVSLVEAKVMDWEDTKVSRIYITSSNSLKREAARTQEMCSVLKQTILQLTMSKFVWCIDIAGIDNYKKGLTSGRIIIDSTCSTQEKEPWLLIHDSKEIRYYDEDKDENYSLQCEIPPYSIYINNLEKVDPI